MTDPEPELQTIDAALDDIGTVGNTARLELHFLSMRAREHTGKLATDMETLEHRLDRGIARATHLAASKAWLLSGRIQEKDERTGPNAEPLDR
jgi:hypothetical protein